jgi:NAD(P)-dependent dehydrogenase (short-subunit alcohol dehydrogenase family)
MQYHSALIVGAGSGLSAALARRFAAGGLAVALAARRPEKLAALCAETGASAYACDAADPASVAALFAGLDPAPDVVVFNASARVRGAVAGLDPEEVRRALEVTAFGGFLVAREALRRMLPQGQGALLLTGATAGVKGFAGSAAFAMGKFALRGLAQALAREVSPQGVHVAHFVIDGGIASAARPAPEGAPDSLLDPAAIAESYWQVMHQPRSAWSWEVELRPWVERF